tara:strand:- start:140 stop:289 length:150 start_codon:yes stop_codon:yes gene_type:complete
MEGVLKISLTPGNLAKKSENKSLDNFNADVNITPFNRFFKRLRCKTIAP